MRPSRLAAVLSLLACSVGCEVGDPPYALGEELKLTRYAPQDSEGMDCNWQLASCGVPANRPLSFQFDRWLLPSTATRQSVQLSVDQTTYTNFTLPQYELLTRTVTYWPSGDLAQGLVHVLSLPDSETNPNGWGFVAYDRRPLARDTAPAAIVFRTGKADPAYARGTPQARLCRDALAAFSRAGCTAAHCHRNRDDELPCAALNLEQGNGLEGALGRVAIATDRAGDSGDPSVMPERFGMNLPLIDAGQPATSFLLYRILIGLDAYRNALGQLEVLPPSAQERSYATTWFGAMGPMPPESVGFPKGVSPVELTRGIEAWIRDGADTAHCDP